MAHCEFTPTFQSDCIRDIILLLRSDPGRDEMLEIVEHSACFLGCGARMLRGSNPILGSSGKKTYDEAADQLAAVMPSDADDDVMRAIPWITIAKILLPILIDLLTEEDSNA